MDSILASRGWFFWASPSLASPRSVCPSDLSVLVWLGVPSKYSLDYSYYGFQFLYRRCDHHVQCGAYLSGHGISSACLRSAWAPDRFVRSFKSYRGYHIARGRWKALLGVPGFSLGFSLGRIAVLGGGASPIVSVSFWSRWRYLRWRYLRWISPTRRVLLCNNIYLPTS